MPTYPGVRNDGVIEHRMRHKIRSLGTLAGPPVGKNDAPGCNRNDRSRLMASGLPTDLLSLPPSGATGGNPWREAGPSVGKSLMFSSSSYREDPRETIDYFYRGLVEELTKIRRMVQDLSTSRKRIELQVKSLEQEERRRNQQLDRAKEAGNAAVADDVATRLAAVQRDLQSFLKKYNQAVETEEEAYRGATAREELVDSFRANKESFKAEYSFATARARSNSQSFVGRGIPADRQIDDDLAVQMGPVLDLLTLDLLDAGESNDRDERNDQDQ